MSKLLLITRELALIGLMAVATCILSPIALPIPLSSVPATFGSPALFLAVYILGMKNGLVSYVIYFLTGIADLPVFFGFSGSMGKIAGPTSGYLIGFFFIVLIAGYFIDKYHARKKPSIADTVLDALVYNLAGTVWLLHQPDASFLADLGSNVTPHLPGDSVKIIATSLLGPELRKAVNRL